MKKSKLPLVDKNIRELFDTGYLFENYAEQPFPDGVKLDFENLYKTHP